MKIWGTVLTGNMGDGWRDNEEAAHGFADYLRKMVEKEYPEVNKIDIRVNRATGIGGGLYSDELEIEDDLEFLYNKAWGLFVGDDGNEFWIDELNVDKDELSMLYRQKWKKCVMDDGNEFWT